MFFARHKILASIFALSLIFTTTNYACNAQAWITAIQTYLPQILQIASAIAPMIGLFAATVSPGDAATAKSISDEVAKDAQVLEDAYKDYQSYPNTNNRKAVEAALETIQEHLPQLLQIAHIKDTSLLIRVTNAVNLVVSLADVIMASMPDKTPTVIQARTRMTRAEGVLGGPLTPGREKRYWDVEVCGGNLACANLVPGRQ